MSIGFLRAFGIAGGKEAIQGLATALVNAAPNTGIKAGTIMEEGKLDDANDVIQRAKKQVGEAQAHFDAVNGQYTQLMGAAEVLDRKTKEFQALADDETKGDGDRASARQNVTTYTGKLNELLDKVEAASTDLEHWRSELAESGQFLAEAEAAYREKTGKLIHSGEEAEQARRDLDRAKMRAEASKTRAADARTIAGLNTDGEGVNPAVAALKRATAAADDEADKNNRKADALRTSASHGTDDPIIASALAEASGHTSPSSVADRLAALRQKAP